MKRSSDFAYRIDYDKEIETDLRDLAVVEKQAVLRAHLTEEELDWERRGAPVSIVTFLTMHPERASLVGLPVSLVYDMAAVEDMLESVPPEHQLTQGWHRRGTELAIKLVAEYDQYFHRDPEKARRVFKARLARHRRNKKKFG